MIYVMKIDKEKEYYTGNVFVIGYLQMVGIKRKRLEQHRDRVIYVYDKNDELNKAIEEFKTNAVIQNYLGNIKQVKDQMYRVKKANENKLTNNTQDKS